MNKVVALLSLAALPGSAGCNISGIINDDTAGSDGGMSATDGDGGEIGDPGSPGREDASTPVAVCAATGADLGDVGATAKWALVEIPVAGPNSSATGNPNPFAIDVDFTFVAPSGDSYRVPAFFDGDGAGNGDGNVWKVRFSADETGTWSFCSTSDDQQLNGVHGSFTVTEPGDESPDFWRWGRLEYTGTAGNGIRYLKFRDGPYWLKAGCDDPENFLGSFSNYDTQAERMAAISYLADRGVNSMYIMTHNVQGDNNDVWPWLGSTAMQAMNNGGANARFDVAKLEQWHQLFVDMTNRGVVPYLVLADDSSWTGLDHQAYYRELVARFGYLPALTFNFGEEANESYSLSEGLALMEVLRDVDPFDHPRGIHNVNSPSNAYVDNEVVSFTSIQTNFANALAHNQLTGDWISACKARGKRILMVNFDEPRPLLDRRGWWTAYMAGGVWEAHVDEPYDRPMSAWQTSWTQLGGARAFMETLPFWEMEADNGLVTAGTGYCLAKPGEAYAVYLPAGGSITVNLVNGATYAYSWWNPDNGYSGSFTSGGTVGGGAQMFTSPGGGDWALRIVAE